MPFFEIKNICTSFYNPLFVFNPKNNRYKTQFNFHIFILFNMANKCIIVDSNTFRQVINQLKLNLQSDLSAEILFVPKDNYLIANTLNMNTPFIRNRIKIETRELDIIDSNEENSLDENMIEDEQTLQNNSNLDKDYFVIDITHLRDFLKSSERGHLLIWANDPSKITFFANNQDTSMMHVSNRIDQDVNINEFDNIFMESFDDENNKCTINIKNLKFLFTTIGQKTKIKTLLRLYITDNDGQKSKSLVIEAVDEIYGPNIFLISNKDTQIENIADKITPFEKNPLENSLRQVENHIRNIKKKRDRQYNRISNELLIDYNSFKHCFIHMMDIAHHADLFFNEKYLKINISYEEGNSECIIAGKYLE